MSFFPLLFLLFVSPLTDVICNCCEDDASHWRCQASSTLAKPMAVQQWRPSKQNQDWHREKKKMVEKGMMLEIWFTNCVQSVLASYLPFTQYSSIKYATPGNFVVIPINETQNGFRNFTIWSNSRKKSGGGGSSRPKSLFFFFFYQKEIKKKKNFNCSLFFFLFPII
jgi:hypothetical protein